MEDRLAKIRSNLTQAEITAYEKYISDGKPPLAASAQAQLYQLFLNGKTCEEIARLNPNLSLGLIVRARVDGCWDEKRDAHIGSLLDGVRERVQHTQLEAVNFACDLLSAVHKLQGDRLKKYLQTGDPNELKELGPLSLKTYRDVVEMLLKLTGQDKEKKVVGEVIHKVEEAPAVEAGGRLSAKQAAKILQALEDEDGD